MREIDRRIRFLTKQLDAAHVVNPSERDSDQVFFGATVTVSSSKGVAATYTIVGLDESDVSRGLISWISPVAKALLKARVGDVVKVAAPGGAEELEVIAVRYGEG